MRESGPTPSVERAVVPAGDGARRRAGGGRAGGRAGERARQQKTRAAEIRTVARQSVIPRAQTKDAGGEGQRGGAIGYKACPPTAASPPPPEKLPQHDERTTYQRQRRGVWLATPCAPTWAQRRGKGGRTERPCRDGREQHRPRAAAVSVPPTPPTRATSSSVRPDGGTSARSTLVSAPRPSTKSQGHCYGPLQWPWLFIHLAGCPDGSLVERPDQNSISTNRILIVSICSAAAALK